MVARDGLPAVRLEPRVQRGASPVHARARLADVHDPRGRLPSVDGHLRAQDRLRARVRVRRPLLFIHQLSHIWLDLRGLRDDRNRDDAGGTTSRTVGAPRLAQQRYAIDNPRKATPATSSNGWGFTASDGPGPAISRVGRRDPSGILGLSGPRRAFGLPMTASIRPGRGRRVTPIRALDVVCETLRHAIEQLARRGGRRSGFDASYNPTFKDAQARGWVAPWEARPQRGTHRADDRESPVRGLIWDLVRREPVRRRRGPPRRLSTQSPRQSR